jgi:hypothetical protein
VATRESALLLTSRPQRALCCTRFPRSASRLSRASTVESKAITLYQPRGTRLDSSRLDLARGRARRVEPLSRLDSEPSRLESTESSRVTVQDRECDPGTSSEFVPPLPIASQTCAPEWAEVGSERWSTRAGCETERSAALRSEASTAARTREWREEVMGGGGGNMVQRALAT